MSCRLAVFLAALGVLSTAAAQPQEAVAQQHQQQQAESTERDRIAQERSKIEADFAAEQKQCYQRFAVNDCLRESRTRRRNALVPLRRQEIGLNDLERQRRAAEQQRRIAQREDERARKSAEAAASQAAAPQPQRTAKPAPPPIAAPGPARAQADKASNPPLAPRRESDQANADRRRADEAARRAERAAQDDENALRHEQKVREAAEHKAKVLRDNAAHDKPAAPLPLPPAAAR